MATSKVHVEDNAVFTLKDLKEFIDDAIEKAGGDEYYYKAIVTWKGKVKSLTIDTSGTAFGAGETGTGDFGPDEPSWKRDL